MWRAGLIVLVACGSAAKAPAPPPPAPVTPVHQPPVVDIDAAMHRYDPPPPVEPVEVVDDGTTKGAVPIPGEIEDPTLPLELADTTVTFAELPPLGAKWQQRKRVRHKGRVPIALNHSYEHLNLTFVSSEINGSGYPGALESFPLVSIGYADLPSWGSSFPGLVRSKAEGPGPIYAAVRVRPRDDAPESERQQVVVYTPPGAKVVLVATKLVGATAWTPLLRVDTPRVERIDLIEPGWH